MAERFNKAGEVSRNYAGCHFLPQLLQALFAFKVVVFTGHKVEELFRDFAQLAVTIAKHNILIHGGINRLYAACDGLIF